MTTKKEDHYDDKQILVILKESILICLYELKKKTDNKKLKKFDYSIDKHN